MPVPSLGERRERGGDAQRWHHDLVFEQPRQRAMNHRLVVNDQHPRGCGRQQGHEDRVAGGVELVVDLGSTQQLQSHGGANSGLALDLDGATHGGHQPMTDGQAQPGALARRFGGEERVEGTRQHLG
jgi:hypothetical protein